MFAIGAYELLGLSGLTKHAQACVFRAFRPTGSPRTRLGAASESLVSKKLGSGSLRGHFGATSGSLRGHRTRPDLGSGSLRGHFGVTWLEKTRLGVTSKPLGSRKLGSGSLRGHLARENSARVHFEATWLEKTQLGVTSRPHGSRKLGSGSLRGHLAREDSALGCFEATWLGKARLGFFRGHLTRLACLGSAWLHLASLNFAQLGRLSPARPVSTHVA